MLASGVILNQADTAGTKGSSRCKRQQSYVLFKILHFVTYVFIIQSIFSAVVQLIQCTGDYYANRYCIILNQAHSNATKKGVLQM